MRKKIIAGNWKMFLTKEKARDLVRLLVNIKIDSEKCQVVVFPSLIYIDTFAEELKKAGLFYGAQNCSGSDQGALTGEISADMLVSIGAKYCLVGHSERRQFLHEQDVECHAKIRALLKHNITPILCVGESLEVREFGKQNEFVEAQLRNGLFDLTADEMTRVIVAYEPVWAIGTGKTATTMQASEMHTFIRDYISLHYKQTVAEKVHILYGGSVKENNAKELMAANDIDGVLVGGASLDGASFSKIVQSA
jgi:triosephosphate isomerase